MRPYCWKKEESCGTWCCENYSKCILFLCRMENVNCEAFSIKTVGNKYALSQQAVSLHDLAGGQFCSIFSSSQLLQGASQNWAICKCSLAGLGKL